ncbi:MAG: hypothetical protein KDA89_14635 [Planctomycetaceae bacterium]|nr:hypothetical protein [Planctomycetaceae bacterium]
MRDAGDTEVGGFGISRKDDLLRIEDFVTVKQKTSAVTVAFDDGAVAEYFDEQVDINRSPEEFARCWIHSHPGSCPLPSPTDEQTFSRVFGISNWAPMIIVAKGGQTYCRLRFNSGPGGHVEIPVSVDYSISFDGSDHDAWKAEYERNVQVERIVQRGPLSNSSTDTKFGNELIFDEAPDLFEDVGFDFEMDPWEDFECRI